MLNVEEQNTTRHLAVTPIDMRQAQFGAAMRGFDKTAVTAFLEEAASGFEAALRENERLRQQIADLQATIARFQEVEGGIKATLMSAQRVADEMRESAHQEAARIIREAEGRAELMTQKAQARVEDVMRDVDGLRMKRREAQTSVEACISALQNTVDFIREQEQREREKPTLVSRQLSAVGSR